MGNHIIVLPIFVIGFILVVLLSAYSERRSIERAFWGTLGALILGLLATGIFEYGKSVISLGDKMQKKTGKNIEIAVIDDVRSDSRDEIELEQELEPEELEELKEESKEPEQESERSDIPRVENIDDMVLEIRTLYNEARANREVYIHKEISTGVVAFYNNEILSFIEVNGEEIGEKYTRWYFYQNDELYFAFVFFKLQENRLYFCSNILFRYINEQGNIYDDGYGVSGCLWEDIVKEESQMYLEMSR